MYSGPLDCGVWPLWRRFYQFYLVEYQETWTSLSTYRAWDSTFGLDTHFLSKYKQIQTRVLFFSHKNISAKLNCFDRLIKCTWIENMKKKNQWEKIKNHDWTAKTSSLNFFILVTTVSALDLQTFIGFLIPIEMGKNNAFYARLNHRQWRDC